MKRPIFIAVVVALAAAPAVADTAGDIIYYHDSSNLYWTEVGDWTVNTVGAFNPAVSSMTDIAFDTDGALYGVGSSGGTTLFDIDTSTAAVTSSAITGGSDLNALSNYGTNLFYTANYTDGTFYSLNVSTNTATPIGTYNDGAAIGTKYYVSAGDIWTTSGGTVYATVNSGSTGYLVTVDTTNAVVTELATLGSNAYYGLAEDASGLLYVINADGTVRTWNGGLSPGPLADVDLGTVWGATARPVPVPGAVLLGMLGLAVAGRKLRKVC